MKTYDVHFNDSKSSDSKGFKISKPEAIHYIRSFNGTDHSYFADYKGSIVSAVCNETGKTVYETEVV